MFRGLEKTLHLSGAAYFKGNEIHLEEYIKIFNFRNKLILLFDAVVKTNA